MKKEKGITLVALVITVVVMLILAGVTIAIVVEGDGIFNRTRQAAEAYNETSQEENKNIQEMMNQIDLYLEGIDNNSSVKPAAIIGTIVTENQTYDGRIESKYYNPIIPKGFAPINENGAIWGTEDGYQKGLVIRDGDGNEFVWVPVDGSVVKLERIEWGVGTEISKCSEVIPSIILTSIEKNEGFYVGRYEAGNFENNVVSKKGKEVWVKITYAQAESKAEAMYNNDNKYGVSSSLLYGAQWDSVLRYIESYNGDNTYALSSRGKGNYQGTYGGDITNNGPDVSGALEAFRQKNIYDIAGNVWEYTMEKSNSHIVRGGDYEWYGYDYPAAYRLTYDGQHPGVGFRVALYIK